MISHPHRASAFGSSLAGSSFSAVSGACKTGEGLPSHHQRKQGRKRKKPQLDLSWMCLSPAKNSKVDDDLSPHQQHAQKCLHKFYDELNHVSSAWNYLDIYPWLPSPPVWPVLCLRLRFGFLLGWLSCLSLLRLLKKTDYMMFHETWVCSTNLVGNQRSWRMGQGCFCRMRPQS